MNLNIENEIYHDVQILKKMEAPDYIKIKILGDLLIRFDDIWRVVGITESALKIFARHNFKKESGMQINRSHIKDRSANDSYQYLVNADLSLEEWWSYLLKINDCILATSSENMSRISSKVIEIDTTLGLFKSSGFAWKHRIKKEGVYLQQLYNEHLK